MLAGGLLLLAPAEVRQRPLREVLRVDPGATCLEAGALAETIESWLGRSGLDPGVAWIEVRGDPARADAVAIAVEIRGERVERSFDPAPGGCGELHAVVGLAVAIAVDTSVLEELGYDVVDPGEAPAQQAQDAERAPLARRPRRGEAPAPKRGVARASFAVGLRGGVWLDVLPGIAGGGAGQLEIGWLGAVDLRVGVWGGYGAAQSFDGGSRVPLALVGGRVDVCAALSRKRLRPRLCFGPAAGALEVGAKSPAVGGSVGPWMALALAPELRIWAARRFALDLTVDLVVPVIRPVLVERDPNKADMIGRSLALPPVGAVVGLGAAFAIR